MSKINFFKRKKNIAKLQDDIKQIQSKDDHWIEILALKKKLARDYRIKQVLINKLELGMHRITINLNDNYNFINASSLLTYLDDDIFDVIAYRYHNKNKEFVITIKDK